VGSLGRGRNRVALVDLSDDGENDGACKREPERRDDREPQHELRFVTSRH
jgi:hypothetical protein